VVGAEHDVDMAGPLAYPLAVLLGEASTDGDLEIRAALLQRLQTTQVAVELVVGVLPDAARVQDHDVGGLDVVGRLETVGSQQTGDPLRVVLVHLAPEGSDVEAARLV